MITGSINRKLYRPEHDVGYFFFQIFGNDFPLFVYQRQNVFVLSGDKQDMRVLHLFKFMDYKWIGDFSFERKIGSIVDFQAFVVRYPHFGFAIYIIDIKIFYPWVFFRPLPLFV